MTRLEDFWKARAIQGWAECVVFEDKPALRLPEPWACQNLLSSPRKDLSPFPSWACATSLGAVVEEVRSRARLLKSTSQCCRFLAGRPGQVTLISPKLLSCLKRKRILHHRICCEDELNLQLAQRLARRKHLSDVTFCPSPSWLVSSIVLNTSLPTPRENTPWHHPRRGLFCEGKKPLHI